MGFNESRVSDFGMLDWATEMKMEIRVCEQCEQCEQCDEDGGDRWPVVVTSSSDFDHCGLCDRYQQTPAVRTVRVVEVFEEACDCLEKHGRILHRNGGSYHHRYYINLGLLFGGGSTLGFDDLVIDYDCYRHEEGEELED